jgi:hypothetical protein
VRISNRDFQSSTLLWEYCRSGPTAAKNLPQSSFGGCTPLAHPTITWYILLNGMSRGEFGEGRRFGWTRIKYTRPEPNTRIITVGNLRAVFICYRLPNCGSWTRLESLNLHTGKKSELWKEKINHNVQLLYFNVLCIFKVRPHCSCSCWCSPGLGSSGDSSGFYLCS